MLKRQDSGFIRKEARETEDIMEGQKSTMSQKIKYMVLKQITQLKGTVEMQSEQLNETVELINDIEVLQSK